MGQLIYGHGDAAIPVDDRTLAHLQVVILNKLRRQEKFVLTLADGTRTRVMFVGPSTPLEFIYSGNRTPRLNQLWLEQLAKAAGLGEGLHIVREPPDET
ncbi:ATP-dependent DNA ligase [Agromyces sp. MMS24-K17]|uniref:DUF7882 family protein n=1 Tax=Agromyces sp. MMS24-K17 TaxID=3372850 RepID=UPI00375426C4